MYLSELPLKYLESNEVLDYEMIEDIHFDYLNVELSSFDDLQYCGELTKDW